MALWEGKMRFKVQAILGFSGMLAAAAVWAGGASMPAVPVPQDNPGSPAKIVLGKQLFFDTRLSKDHSISCNSCHDVNKGGVDGQAFSKGVGGQLGGRNAPTVLNAAFHSVQFWDGRADSLEAQAKGPLVNPKEMAMPNHDAVVAEVKSIPGYAKEFEKVFGKDAINIDNIAKAIAAYERTLITLNSPFDRFQKGEKNALNAEQKKGWELFQSTGCVACHSGPHFSGPAMPAGTGFYQKFPTMENTDFDKKYGFSKDLGRFEVTKKEEDKHMFRVPTLRNVALTAPYFHNGAVDNLPEAVKVMGKLQLGKDISDADAKSIAAFLASLTGKLPAQKAPVLPQ
jgi:cytochrome c peroxidase